MKSIWTHENVAHLDDRLIVRLIALGHQEAFDSLYARYESLAFKFALAYVNDRVAAQDIVQEAFFSIWRAAGNYDGKKGEPRSWLLQIVRNRSVDYLRHQPTKCECAADEFLLDRPSDENVAAEAEHLERRAIVREAVCLLPRDQRAVIELAYFEGLTHAQTAARLRLPLGTVKGRVRLGLRNLRGIIVAVENDRTGSSRVS